YGLTRHGFEATGKVNRKDFGVSWNKPMDGGGVIVSDEVHILISGEATEDK
ncbi:MAG: YceI family protein, partial [Spirochaetia bacterium]|nr:YceI family protein [Spirochaetia bacterium]